MKFEEAIKTAIAMEEEVQNFYQNNADQFKSKIAGQIFETLAKEEKDHVAFLQDQLQVWTTSGKIDSKQLSSSIPNKELVQKIMSDVTSEKEAADVDRELTVFKKALEIEVKISKFYQDLMEQLSGNEKDFFQGFQEIEEYHEAIIQAEISSAVGSGVWFDFMEFDQEAG